MKTSVKLVLKDVKKGSVRYDATDPDGIVGNIYASKLALALAGVKGAPYPPTVTVTVEWEG
jgi:hypothetical protein